MDGDTKSRLLLKLPIELLYIRYSMKRGKKKEVNKKQNIILLLSTV